MPVKQVLLFKKTKRNYLVNIMKKCFLTGVAAVVVGLAVVSCSHDSDTIQPTNSDQLANATEKLGVEVDPSQDWNMTSKVTANISVNLGLDQEYTIGIYEQNPLFNDNVVFYAKGTVSEGGTEEITFEAPSANSSFYVAVFDSKKRYLVQSVNVEDGVMNAVFGTDTNGTRATEAENPTYAKTLNDFLNPTVETCAEFVSKNNSYRWMVDQGVLEVVDNTLSAETMHAYTAFTNADLDEQATLSDLIYKQGSSGSSTQQTATYKVAANYDPASGTSVNVMNGSTKVGTLTFGDRVSVSGGSVEAEFVWWLNQGNNNHVFSVSSDNYKNEYGGGYGLDASHYITLTPVQTCTVMIEQSTATSNSIKFDNTELSVSSATTNNNRRIYTLTGVSAGTHTISKGNGDSGILKCTVTYGGGTAAISDGSYDFAWDGYSNRLTRTYYRFTPDVSGSLMFYHKAGGSNNAITVKDNNNYFQKNYQDFHNWAWYGADIPLEVVAGHTYEITLNTSDDGFYGVKMVYTETSGGSEASSYYVGHGDGKHYRVAAGTTVNHLFHINSTQGKVNETVIYVEGTLYIGTNCTLNGVTIVVAGGGNLVINGTANMSNAGRFVVMPGGQIVGANDDDGSKPDVYNVNNGMPCYNAGTINFKGEVNINGSNFYNCGKVNVDVLRNTSGGLITNFGQITARTNKDAADAYNCTFVNACYMHYTENAGIGHLTMLKDSRLDVDGMCEFNQSWQTLPGADAADPYTLKNATIASPNILMANSVVNVASAFVTNTVFQGPTAANEVAIVKMGKVVVGNGTDLMQRENCYFDWDVTELYKKDGQGIGEKYQDIPAGDKVYNPYGYLSDYYRVHVTKFISEASSPVSIPADDTDCGCTGAGYNPDGKAKAVEDRPAVWSYAYEDTPLGDYDMNDVVIKVSYAYDEENDRVDYSHLSVTLCCTGATLGLKVYLGDAVLFGDEEVHAVLGRVVPEMVNTGVGPTADPYTTTIATPANFEFGTADFWIESPLVPGGVHIAKAGQDPHGVVIPEDWAWPTEYTCIKDAYPNFIEFAKDASTTNEAIRGWYKKTSTNPVAGKTYKQ